MSKYDIEDTYENLIDGITLEQTLRIHKMLHIDPDGEISPTEGMRMGIVLRWYQAMRRNGDGVPDLDNLCLHVGGLPHVVSISHAMRVLDGRDTQVNQNQVTEFKFETKPEEDIITRFHRLEIM